MDLKSIGIFMLILGVFAIGLDFVGRVPSILVWIYTWGEMVAWAIKIALVVVGGALIFVAHTQASKKAVETNDETKKQD